MVRVLLVLTAVLAALGQTPADLYTYEEYRAWLTRQPAAVQRSAEVLETYRAYLVGKGEDGADAESKIRVIRQQEPSVEVEPDAFLVEMVKGRPVGRALELGKGRNAAWLARQGWNAQSVEQVVDFGVDRWDLIVLRYVNFREQAGVIMKALRPGGMVVVEAYHRDAAKGRAIDGGVVFDTAEVPGLFRELRVVRYQEPMAVADFGKQKVRVVQFCAERPGE
jgi:hypothetical protein